MLTLAIFSTFIIVFFFIMLRSISTLLSDGFLPAILACMMEFVCYALPIITIWILYAHTH